MRLRTAILLLSVCIIPGANAAVSVPGSGLAHACYVAALQASALAGEKDCSTALDDATLSLRNRAATYVNRGVLRTSLRRYDAALADYDRAVAMGKHLSPPDLALAHVDRASVLISIGRFAEAIADANMGLNLGTPKPEFAYYNRALAEDYLGNFKAAYHDYKQALAVVPDFTPAADQLRRYRVESRPANGT